jgi:hypothetical protein
MARIAWVRIYTGLGEDASSGTSRREGEIGWLRSWCGVTFGMGFGRFQRADWGLGFSFSTSGGLENNSKGLRLFPKED